MPNDIDPSPADFDLRPAARPIWQRVSFVWLVPALALIISLGVAYQNYASQGVLIEISFENASGVTADETVIKYRDVTIGRVEKVTFAAGLSDVLVYVRVDAEIAPYLDDDAEFWVVRPDVSVRGITGLDTVLGGVYIEGNWDTSADVAQLSFVGVENPPITRAGQRGSVITLRARDGSALSAGAPILHKGIKVGYLETPELSFNGRDVIVSAFIEAPYDRRITSTTRFWDTSGFSIKFGASGVALNVDSLATLIEGGIAFDTVVSGGRPLVEGQLFDLFDDEDTARSSLFAKPNQEVLDVSVLFEQSVSGLSVGSEVRFQGIRIGQVTELGAFVVDDRNDQQVRLRANLAIEPGRLGLGADATPAQALTFLEDFVLRGLRARMITGNILSGSLQVEFLQVETAPTAVVRKTDDGFPIIPTTRSEITDVAATAEGVLDRINSLPVEELMSGAIDMMDSIERLASDDGLRAAPASLTALLDEARGLIANEDVQAVPADLRAALGELNKVIASADEAQIVAKLAATLETANTAVTNIEQATRNLPQITAQIEAVIAKATALELDQLVAEATATLASIDALLGADATADLPASVSAALDEMRLFLAEVREGGAVENVNAALASASAAAKAFETSVQGFPALSQRATNLVARTEAVVDSYGERSRFGMETLGTLRDIQAAADAVTNLARTIQRNPSSLLTGR